MNKVIPRLLVFSIGIPLVIFIVWLPFFNHVSLHLLITVFSFLGAVELYNMFAKKYSLLSKGFIITCSILIPISGMIYTLLDYFTNFNLTIGTEIYTYVLIATILLTLFVELATAPSFEKSNERIAFSSFVILYAGYLFSFISRISFISTTDAEGNIVNLTTPLLACFVLMVFLCDSIAWFFGVLLGKNNKGFVKASPNKSIAGFIGGFIGSIMGGLIAYFVWPNVFAGSVIKIIVIGIIIAFSSITGDLIESVFKRSADVKDSGHVIPGRGGALDSVDSLLMSAPIFYLLITLFYNF